MRIAILDACGAINLFASGRGVEILRGSGFDWRLPAAVAREAQQIRVPDPDDASKLVGIPLDFGPAIAATALALCDCETTAETELYVEMAGRLQDDGESMALAIAKRRDWSILTDDKKARRIAGELCVPVIGTPQVLRLWALNADVDPTALSATLAAIRRCANYLPSPSVADGIWWLDALAGADAKNL